MSATLPRIFKFGPVHPRTERTDISNNIMLTMAYKMQYIFYASVPCCCFIFEYCKKILRRHSTGAFVHSALCCVHRDICQLHVSTGSQMGLLKTWMLVLWDSRCNVQVHKWCKTSDGAYAIAKGSNSGNTSFPQLMVWIALTNKIIETVKLIVFLSAS
jgi:hypothetical protein